MTETEYQIRPAFDVAAAAESLIALHGMDFAGKKPGKFRISRKFLREITGRRRLPEWYIQALSDSLFEQGYVLIDLESYLVVIKTAAFNSTRRVTSTAIDDVLSANDGRQTVN